MEQLPISYRGPVDHSLTAQKIDKRCREYMEWGLARLEEKGLDAVAAGTGDYDQAADRLARLSPSLRRFHTALARDVSAYLQWRKSMEIYDTHPAVTASLMRLGSKSRIPGATFRRLRHRNPYIAIPGTVPVTHGGGHPGRVHGFYVSGMLSGKHPLPTGVTLPDRATMTHAGFPAVLLDTQDKAANALQVTLTSEVLNSTERDVLDFDLCRLTIPLTKDFTLEELVEEVAASGFSWWTAEDYPDIQQDVERTYLTTMARVAISHLLYACSRTAEIADPPVRGSDIKRKKGKPKPTKQRSRIHPVGYRMGAAIESSVRRAAEQRQAGEPGPGTGRRMPPHIRAPHSHLYWVGPGRQEAEIKFLDQIPVNLSDDQTETATIHPMK